MDKATAGACVLAVALVASSVNAQVWGPDRVEGMRFVPELMLEAPGSDAGTTVRDLRPFEARPLWPGCGVMVTSVVPGSPAARAGLELGDIVIAFDRVSVNDARQFARLVRHTSPGRMVMTMVVRKGQHRYLPLTL